MEADQLRVEAACVTTNSTVRFTVASQDCKIVQKYKDEVLIIDEVDAVAIDKCATFAKPRANINTRIRMIGLTATTTNEMLDYESSYLQLLGFNLYDSKIEASFNSPPKAASWASFFKETQGMARLIYIDPRELESVA